MGNPYLRLFGLKTDEIIEEINTTDEDLNIYVFEKILKLLELKKILNMSSDPDAETAKKVLDKIITHHKIKDVREE